MHPPFSFRSCRKENGPCTVQKKRTPLVALRRLRASALYGGRREMVPAGLRGLSDGRGGVRYRLDGRFPRRGCRQQRAARTHLTSSFFRAFRFATRCPGSCRGLYQTGQKAFRIPVGADALIGPLPRLPSTTGQRQRKEKQRQYDDHPDALRTIRHGTAVTKIAEDPSVPDGKAKSALAPIRRPPSRGGPLHRSAPKRLFLFHRARRILFLGKAKKRMGGAPLWEQPLAGARPPRPPSGGPPIPPWAPAHQKFPQFAKTKPLSNFSKE